MALWAAIEAAIGAATGDVFEASTRRGVGGGCINSAYRLDAGGRSYFVKLNDASKADMFQAEAEGLNEIARTRTIRVPRPVCWGSEGSSAYIVMEYLSMGGSGKDALAQLGRQLAAMHQATSSKYGWHIDNTIGSTPQINTYCDDWIGFFQNQRIGFQLKLAARNGYRGRLQDKGERLQADLAVFFRDYHPPASLLHGDLWSGNYSIEASGEPVIFDPAVYYGDRETDLAMTELFGGFSAGFYAAYQDAYPLDNGYTVRKTLYNLYHVLNHLNLFGGGYGSQAEHMMDSLLSEIHG